MRSRRWWVGERGIHLRDDGRKDRVCLQSRGCHVATAEICAEGFAYLLLDIGFPTDGLVEVVVLDPLGEGCLGDVGSCDC